MLLSLLEMAGNKALEFDQASLSRLEKLRGKTMTLHLKSLDQSITVTPQPSGLEFSTATPDRVDVTLSTTLGAMIKISRDGLENAELKSGELEMQGDPIIGQRFAQLIADLNIDWQALLSEQIGDAPAKTIIAVSGQAKNAAQQARQQLHHAVQDLIQNDLQVVVGSQAVNEYLDEVDNLKTDVERLKARVDRIRQTLD